MFTLRCTQKLLARIDLDPVADNPPATTVLGDWYANLVRAGRTQVILAVSERTLLPVVIAAREARNMAQRLTDALEPMLLCLGVPAESVAAERQAMRDCAFARTVDRRILGSLKELAFQLEVGLLEWPERPLLTQSLWLAGTPMKVIDHGPPEAAAVAAFAARRAIEGARDARTSRNEPSSEQ
ncbi:MAG: hypothetical protein J0L58_01290 [Burkholderiales bacterium]|nr:hypothetical protein [Burkholderiales bacterium]